MEHGERGTLLKGAVALGAVAFASIAYYGEIFFFPCDPADPFDDRAHCPPYLSPFPYSREAEQLAHTEGTRYITDTCVPSAETWLERQGNLTCQHDETIELTTSTSVSSETETSHHNSADDDTGIATNPFSETTVAGFLYAALHLLWRITEFALNNFELLTLVCALLRDPWRPYRLLVAGVTGLLRLFWSAIELISSLSPYAAKVWRNVLVENLKLEAEVLRAQQDLARTRAEARDAGTRYDKSLTKRDSDASKSYRTLQLHFGEAKGELDTIIRGERRRVEELRDSLRDAQLKIKIMESENSGNHALQAEAATTRDQIKALNASIIGYATEVIAVGKRNISLMKHNTNLKSQAGASEARIRVLQEDMMSCDEKAREIERNCNSKAAEIRGLKKQLEQKQKECDQKAKGIAWDRESTAQELKSLRQQTEQKQKDFDKYKTQQESTPPIVSNSSAPSTVTATTTNATNSSGNARGSRRPFNSFRGFRPTGRPAANTPLLNNGNEAANTVAAGTLDEHGFEEMTDMPPPSPLENVEELVAADPASNPDLLPASESAATTPPADATGDGEMMGENVPASQEGTGEAMQLDTDDTAMPSALEAPARGAPTTATAIAPYASGPRHENVRAVGQLSLPGGFGSFLQGLAAQPTALVPQHNVDVAAATAPAPQSATAFGSAGPFNLPQQQITGLGQQDSGSGESEAMEVDVEESTDTDMTDEGPPSSSTTNSTAPTSSTNGPANTLSHIPGLGMHGQMQLDPSTTPSGTFGTASTSPQPTQLAPHCTPPGTFGTTSSKRAGTFGTANNPPQPTQPAPGNTPPGTFGITNNRPQSMQLVPSSKPAGTWGTASTRPQPTQYPPSSTRPSTYDTMPSAYGTPNNQRQAGGSDSAYADQQYREMIEEETARLQRTMAANSTMQQLPRASGVTHPSRNPPSTVGDEGPVVKSTEEVMDDVVDEGFGTTSQYDPPAPQTSPYPLAGPARVSAYQHVANEVQAARANAQRSMLARADERSRQLAASRAQAAAVPPAIDPALSAPAASSNVAQPFTSHPATQGGSAGAGNDDTTMDDGNSAPTSGSIFTVPALQGGLMPSQTSSFNPAPQAGTAGFTSNAFGATTNTFGNGNAVQSGAQTTPAAAPNALSHPNHGGAAAGPADTTMNNDSNQGMGVGQTRPPAPAAPGAAAVFPRRLHNRTARGGAASAPRTAARKRNARCSTPNFAPGQNNNLPPPGGPGASGLSNVQTNMAAVQTAFNPAQAMSFTPAPLNDALFCGPFADGSAPAVLDGDKPAPDALPAANQAAAASHGVKPAPADSNALSTTNAAAETAAPAKRRGTGLKFDAHGRMYQLDQYGDELPFDLWEAEEERDDDEEAAESDAGTDVGSDFDFGTPAPAPQSIVRARKFGEHEQEAVIIPADSDDEEEDEEDEEDEDEEDEDPPAATPPTTPFRPKPMPQRRARGNVDLSEFEVRPPIPGMERVETNEGSGDAAASRLPPTATAGPADATTRNGNRTELGPDGQVYEIDKDGWRIACDLWGPVSRDDTTDATSTTNGPAAAPHSNPIPDARCTTTNGAAAFLQSPARARTFGERKADEEEAEEVRDGELVVDEDPPAAPAPRAKKRPVRRRQRGTKVDTSMYERRAPIPGMERVESDGEDGDADASALPTARICVGVGGGGDTEMSDGGAGGNGAGGQRDDDDEEPTVFENVPGTQTGPSSDRVEDVTASMPVQQSVQQPVQQPAVGESDEDDPLFQQVREDGQ